MTCNRSFKTASPNSFNGGEVYCDDSAFSGFCASVDKAVEDAGEAKTDFIEAMNLVSKFMNFGEELQKVEEGNKKVSRLKNFKMEMTTFVQIGNSFSESFQQKCYQLINHSAESSKGGKDYSLLEKYDVEEILAKEVWTTEEAYVVYLAYEKASLERFSQSERVSTEALQKMEEILNSLKLEGMLENEGESYFVAVMDIQKLSQFLVYGFVIPFICA